MKMPGKLRFSLFITCFAISTAMIVGLAMHSNQLRFPRVSTASLLADARSEWAEIGLDTSVLSTGDIVLRSGRGFFSNAMRKMGLRDRTFSHCGWISRDENNRIWVYHSLGGTDNPEAKIRKETLWKFCNKVEVVEFAFYAYDLSPGEIRKADSIAKRLYEQGIQFDLKFDLETKDKLYCSEFIYTLVTQATNDMNYLPLSWIKGKWYVGMDDLFLNDHCKKIAHYAYK
jgi:hypothetical protein